MKKLLHLVALTATVSSLAISAAPAQSAKKGDTKKTDTTSASQAKISKADAERMVMQRNPGANVVNTIQATVQGRQVWQVSYTATGDYTTRKIYVDQDTGKMTH